MKILLIVLFIIVITFYGISCGILMKALKTEDCERKIKAHKIKALGTLVFIVFFVLSILHLIWKFL